MYSQNSHTLALKLREEGKSLKDIAKILKIAKSTASYWLTGKKNKGAFGTMSRTEWLATIRPLSHKAAKLRREQQLKLNSKKIQRELENYNPDLLTKKAILTSLYWAEGSKTNNGTINFANTDSHLIRLFITLFRQCYPLNEDKFRMRLHLHPYHDEIIAKNYWSNLTHIPIEKIGKIYWKKEPNSGKRFRENFMGICFVRYNSAEILRDLIAFAHHLGEKLTK